MPSMREVDVKNQPTTTLEQSSMRFREPAGRYDSGDLRDENERTNAAP